MFLILSYSRLSSGRKDILTLQATRIEPLCCRAQEPQILSPQATTTDVCEPKSPSSLTREATTVRSPCNAVKRSPCSSREKPTKQEKTQHSQK